jgi:hypothetical protein
VNIKIKIYNANKVEDLNTDEILAYTIQKLSSATTRNV